jgi:hypothetical protein
LETQDDFNWAIYLPLRYGVYQQNAKVNSDDVK